MTGIEKVTAKILADAEAEAKAILDRADAECAAMKARCEATIKTERERLDEAAQKECADIVARARSAAAVAKRNVLLEGRARLVEETYEAAQKEIKQLSPEAYLELLTTMLRGAIRRQMASEQESMDLYGEDISPETYEVILRSADRDRYGEKLLDSLNRSLVGKVKLSDLKKVVLATDTARIDGGLILRCGTMEINCSFEMMFAEVRRQTEGRVNQLLFAENK